MIYKNKKVLIIAEAGVNHNGNIKLAKKLIDKAILVGANAIKFQTFKTENLVHKNAKKADYQKNTANESDKQIDMLKKLELSFSDFVSLNKYCKKKKIEFLTSAFDDDSLEFVVNKIKPKYLKIPSGEITNGPFILKHALSGKKIILSSGMSNLKNIEDALKIIAFGYLNKKKKYIKPSVKKFNIAYKNIKAIKLLNKNVILLQCTTEYPTKLNDINLDTLNTFKKKFGLSFGLSDHSTSILPSLLAVNMGAKIIEKHFTLNKNFKGPDHKSSLNPNEFKKLVNEINNAIIIKGSHVKKVYKSERKNIIPVRKSMYARINIKKGELFSNKNIIMKRPGVGISPMKFWEIIGKKSKYNFSKGQKIKL